MHFLLEYDVVPDYVARRAAHREEHLRLARAAVARGELVLGGAFDPPVGAALLFQGDTAEAAERFARADPYVTSGIVTAWRVRRWTTVVGPEAAVRVDATGAPPRTEDEASDAAVAAFLRMARFWTVATVGADGAPASAVIGVAVMDDLSLVFDTLGSSRKGTNLRRDPRVAMVMWSGAATAQIDGLADEPTGDARAAAHAVYLAAFPSGAERTSWPDFMLVRVRPRRIRISDFAGAAPTVVTVTR